MNQRAKSIAILVCVTLFCGCGVYTFSGSTLPSHLKTVDIPLFGNQSLQPEIAEELTETVNSTVLSSNLLDVVGSGGDATISGVITSYEHHPYTYAKEDFRSIDVSQYSVKISVNVEFLDNKKGKPLYEGRVTGEGIYNIDSETEEAGQKKALKEIVDQIMQNSVQSW